MVCDPEECECRGCLIDHHAQAPKQKEAEPFVMQLDVEVAAPVIVIPRSTDSTDHMRVHLGALALSNECSWGLSESHPQGEVSPQGV